MEQKNNSTKTHSDSSLNICKLVEVVYNKAKGKELKFSYLKANQRYFNQLNHFLGTTSTETLILIPIVVNKVLAKQNIEVAKIIEWLNIGISEAPIVHLTLQSLIRKGLIKRKLSRWNKEASSYHLAEIVERAIISGDNLKNTLEIEFNFESYIENYSEIFQEMENDEAYYEDLKNEVHNLWGNYKEIPFIEWASQFNLDLDAKIILSSMLYFNLILGKEDINVDRIINLFEKKPILKQHLKLSLLDGTNKLLRYNLISFSNNDLASIDKMVLTKLVIENLDCKTYQVSKSKNITLKRGKLIMPDKIEEESLYFNQEEQNKLLQIENILQSRRYDSTIKAIEESQILNNVTIILFGPSGTGKTSSAKFIAKRTNRPIYEVQTETIRDMFVGESEKNLSQIFSEYEACKNYLGVDPILLLNEADSLLGNRINTIRGSDKMENSMVNILLEKLESFKGIFIATTNLIKNIDKAFERRILFKIKIDKPNRNTQKKIIKSNFKKIKDNTIEKVLNEFSLTGAEIRNINKRFLINRLINQELEIEDCFYELCQEEFSISNQSSNKIGFR